jgi:type VI secretion system protein ImpB
MGQKKSSQRFIAQNRKPRVHIEYNVDTNGAKETIQLPFVMAVMTDLSGKSEVEKKIVAEREFETFDTDNFEQKMGHIAPRAAFAVDNTLSGEGKLMVDMTFKSMDDFTPDNIAKAVPALAELLEARQQLSDLITYMDGKSDAQERMGELLTNPTLLAALAAAGAKKNAEDEAS